jgi:nitroreductase
MPGKSAKEFASCPDCGFSWEDRDLFLEDRKVELTEYRANFKNLPFGKFYFSHHGQAPESEPLALPVAAFEDLYTGPVYRVRATGSLYCSGYCFDSRCFEVCNSICECSSVRETLRVVLEWPKKEDPLTGLLAQLAERCRSYRRFDESKPVFRQTLLDLVNLARLCPSASNQQPLKYFISCDKELNDAIFPALSWAKYFRDWKGPAEGERPTGYVVILADNSITKNIYCDDGIAAQMMKLGATERGYGGCIINAFDESRLRETMKLPDYMDIRLVLALGVPAETVKLESADGSIRYYKDGKDVVHVPKRPLDEIIINLPKKSRIPR